MVEEYDDATYGLLLNGLDFLVSAPNHLKGAPTARGMKYGVLHLSAGAALVLKERLRREHPRLVFEKVERFSQSAYVAGNFKSVGVSRAIERIGELGVSVPMEARAALGAMQRERNRLEHFGAKISVEELTGVTASVLSFTVDFVSQQLPKVTEEEEELLEEIRGGLTEFDALVKARLAEIAPRLAEAPALRTCPRCATKALMLGDEKAECAFCTRKLEPVDAANDYVEQVLGISSYVTVKDGGEWPVTQCPDCENDDVLVAEDDDHICFQCGTIFPPGSLCYCSKCNTPFRGDAEMSVCGNCFAAMSDDD